MRITIVTNPRMSIPALAISNGYSFEVDRPIKDILHGKVCIAPELYGQEFGYAFIDSAVNNNCNIIIITSSATAVNYVGQLIFEGRVGHTNVKLVEGQETFGMTHDGEITEYSDRGVSWNFGQFS